MSTKPRSNSISSSTISDGSEDTVKNVEEGQAASRLEKEIFGGTDDEDLSELEDMDVSSDEDEAKKSKSTSIKIKQKKPTPDDQDHDYVDQGPSKQKITKTKLSGHKRRRTIAQSDKYILDSDEEGNEKGKQREAEEYDFENQIVQKRRKIKRSRKSKGSENEDGESSKVTRTLTPFEEISRMVDKQFDEMLKSTSSRKRKKNDLDYDAQNDDIAQKLYSKMIKCADIDQNACSEGKISFARMNYLDDAYKLLTRPYLTESLMDHNILEAIRAWLEPLPDQSLPPIELQEQMLTVLDRLPINVEQIRTSHIGKIVRFYMICPRFDQKVQRMAEDLVYKWTRMAFNKTADYRQRPMKTVEYDPQELMAKYNPNELLSKIEDEQQKEASSGRMHARIPLPAARDYDYVPIVKNPVMPSGRNAASKKFTGVYKRINKKMLQLQRGR